MTEHDTEEPMAIIDFSMSSIDWGNEPVFFFD